MTIGEHKSVGRRQMLMSGAVGSQARGLKALSDCQGSQTSNTEYGHLRDIRGHGSTSWRLFGVSRSLTHCLDAFEQSYLAELIGYCSCATPHAFAHSDVRFFAITGVVVYPFHISAKIACPAAEPNWTSASTFVRSPFCRLQEAGCITSNCRGLRVPAPCIPRCVGVPRDRCCRVY